MKLAVIGSRSFNNYFVIEEILNEQFDLHEGHLELISGGANGVDKLVEQYANIEEIKIKVIKPEYEKYNLAPKVAPLVRNDKIAAECDQMLAFWNGHSKGTLDAITKAVQRGKFVMIQGV